MRDCDIRSALGSKLRSEKGAAACLVEELGLCQGDVFVDLAVVDGCLEGYEIKSDHMTSYLSEAALIDPQTMRSARSWTVLSTLAATRGCMRCWAPGPALSR